MPDVSLLPPGDNVAVARALVFAMGEEWQRADILDRLEIAYGWLAKGGQAVHVATELRRIADVLDADPAAYFQAALKRLIADLCPGCDQAAA